MSVRIIILLLALPLFLLLAAVNSVLLYREDTADMEAGLRDEALAAAVTVAEFAKASPDPFAELAEPRRLAALHSVDQEITGLDALYLIRPGGPPLNLLTRPIAEVRQGPAPAKADVLGTWEDAKGRHLITALAPIGQGMMVVADIDAEPLTRRAFHLKRMSIALIAGAAVLALLIGLLVTRRVIGEFRRTRAIIDADGDRPRDELAIREVRDLADAVHLIDSSVASELQRLGKEGEGDPAIGIAAARARHFPDISVTAGGAALSIRSLPNAPAGSFYVHHVDDRGCDLVLGEIGGEPARALAVAIALKSHLLASKPDQLVDRYREARDVFGVVNGVEAVGLTGVIALNANPAALNGYADRNPGLNPDALTADLATLFPDAAIVAATSG